MGDDREIVFMVTPDVAVEQPVSAGLALAAARFRLRQENQSQQQRDMTCQLP